MSGRGTLVAVLALMAPFGPTGCYAFVPAMGPGDVAPGDQVRVQVAGEPSEQLRLFVGDGGRVAELGGTVESWSGDGLMLLLPSAYRAQGFHTETLSQRVMIPEANLLEVDRREIHQGRTGAVVGATALVLGGILWQVLSSDSGGNTAPNPPPGPAQVGTIGVR